MFVFPLQTLVRSESEKQLSSFERKKCVEIMLQYNFPMFMYIFNSAFQILFGLAAIGLQIASIIVKSPLYYIGAGIWVGVIMISIECVCLILGFYISFFNSYLFICLKNLVSKLVAKEFETQLLGFCILEKLKSRLINGT